MRKNKSFNLCLRKLELTVSIFEPKEKTTLIKYSGWRAIRKIEKQVTAPSLLWDEMTELGCKKPRIGE